LPPVLRTLVFCRKCDARCMPSFLVSTWSAIRGSREVVLCFEGLLKSLRGAAGHLGRQLCSDFAERCIGIKAALKRKKEREPARTYQFLLSAISPYQAFRGGDHLAFRWNLHRQAPRLGFGRRPNSKGLVKSLGKAAKDPCDLWTSLSGEKRRKQT